MTDIDNKVETFWFGQYQGQKIADIQRLDPSYIRWCLEKGALHKSQIGGKAGEKIDEESKATADWEEGLAEYFKDRDLPREVSRSLTSSEAAKHSPKYDLHRISPSAWPRSVFGGKKYSGTSRG